MRNDSKQGALRPTESIRLIRHGNVVEAEGEVD